VEKVSLYVLKSSEEHLETLYPYGLWVYHWRKVGAYIPHVTNISKETRGHHVQNGHEF
jgi:hypothetical protein